MHLAQGRGGEDLPELSGLGAQSHVHAARYPGIGGVRFGTGAGGQQEADPHGAPEQPAR